MTRKISAIFTLTLMLTFVHLKAQEVLFPLEENHVIKEYLKAHPVSSVSEFRIRALGDTVTLPFRDDFSRQGIYPHDDLWSDMDAFINTTFAVSPVTIGVATLDGIDRFGRPYDSLSGATDTADFLTSNPIHLYYPGNNTVWFSFFYQPQGLGDEPEPGDSLSLQFLDSSGNWTWMWSRDGRPDTAFQRVNIHITDSIFLYDGFRFRFLNYATLNGNRDHWNIDYVWLATDRSNNDSLFDISLVNPIKTYLTEFNAMPYSHYKYLTNAGNNPVKSSVVDTIRYFKYNTGASSLVCEIRDESGSSVFNQNFTPIGITSPFYTDASFTLSVPDTVFPSLPNSKYADFLINHRITAPATGLSSNDTSYFVQHFQNYYAYDDGSAELAYGINEALAKIAYRFDVKMADTLRGVQIYFNPVGDIVHNRLFKLCVWSSVNVSANTDQIVYQMINQRPYNIDSINGFATYLFDQLITVNPGPIYIGWIQNDATLLGIGVDRNTVSTSNMFSFYTGLWHQAQVQGSWMMRPLFGDTIFTPVGINEPAMSESLIDLFPNPASTSVSVVIHSDKNPFYDYALFNNLGELILSGPVSSGRIDVSDLSTGFYFVRLTDRETKASVTKKLVIQRDGN